MKIKTINMIKNLTITLLAAFCIFAGLQVYSAPGLKFAQLSDTHYYTGENNTAYKLIGESPKLLDDAVEQINEIPDISFVMVTGDLIDKAYEKELLAFLPHMEKLNCAWYFAFGNHDTSVNGELTKELFIKDVQSVNPDFKFTNSYYAFSPKKHFKVIVLDSIIRDRITSNGQIDGEQLNWLDEQIKSSPGDVILIFMHNPVIEPFPSASHRLLNAGEVDGILHKYKNPTAVFTGHYHAGRIIQNGNVLYVNTPSTVTYPNAFRVIKVTNYRTKAVFDIQFKETRLKNLQKLAKIMVFGSPAYSSEEPNAVYEIARKK
ncbi:MAG: metallophosphoesterase [Heliobacteriaceae bacterium]|jgi:3',5'-cyclic AMP phosphodiesterase CpdA|nr:metallophosphoesterase [Heliobacteriaceae bacterium]